MRYVLDTRVGDDDRTFLGGGVISRGRSMYPTRDDRRFLVIMPLGALSSPTTMKAP